MAAGHVARRPPGHGKSVGAGGTGRKVFGSAGGADMRVYAKINEKTLFKYEKMVYNNSHESERGTPET